MRFIELKHLGVDADKINEALKANTMTGEEAQALVAKEGKELKYAVLIKKVVETVSLEGVDVAKMRKHLRILDAVDSALDAGETVLEIEDNDYNLLKKLVQAHKWTEVERNILAFCDDIENAPTTDPRDKEEAAA